MPSSLVFALPYVRIGTHELWIERVSPTQRERWFDVAADRTGTTIGFAWWDLQFSRVASHRFSIPAGVAQAEAD